MAARLYALLFTLLVGFGVWFQRGYMEVYSAEFEAQVQSDKMQSVMLEVKALKARQYQDGRLKAIILAREGLLYNNGKVLAHGDLVYDDFSYGPDGEKQMLRLSVHTPRATARFQVAQDGRSFFDNARKIENLELPENVLARSQAAQFNTRNVKVDLVRGIMETKEPVRLEDPGFALEGMGLHYVVESGDVRIGGKVSGQLQPARRLDLKNLRNGVK